MIKQICSISGLPLATLSSFQLALPTLSTVRNGAPLLGEHWIFQLPVTQIALLSSHTPPEQLSRTERHLLFLAMARATGCIQQEYPCTLACTGTAEEQTTAATWDAALLKAWDSCAALLRLLVSNQRAWRKALSQGALPILVLRRGDGRNLPDFLLHTLYPIANAYLDAVAAGHSPSALPSPDDDDTRALPHWEKELNFERELKKALAFYGTKRAAGLVSYTPTVGRKVLQLLRIEFPALLTPALWEQYQEILLLPAEKAAAKYPTQSFRALQELISTIPAGLGSEDTVVRSYKLLTIRHLDTLISYEYTLAEMFGGATTRAVSQYSHEAGVQWEVRGLSTDPMQQAMAALADAPAVAPKAPNSSNPLAQKLRAKREAMLAAAGGAK